MFLSPAPQGMLLGFHVLWWITHVVPCPVAAFSTPWGGSPPSSPLLVVIPQQQQQRRRPSSIIHHRLAATLDDDMTTTTPTITTTTTLLLGNPFLKAAVLESWNKIVNEEQVPPMSDDNNNDDDEDKDNGEMSQGLYALGQALKSAGIPAMGLKGSPFVLRSHELSTGAAAESFGHSFFTMKDVAKAVEDDFLDAAKGSTDNRKGWKITTVSNPRGDSFEEARMTYQDIITALEKGTVIFNAAGAHIPKLAGTCLAFTEGTMTPNALNVYLTAAGMRTSAPPHTDKQDVMVVQTSGSKFWRVYAPTDPTLKPTADLFARGKGEDDLPLYLLKESGTLLLETTLQAGDVLFIPSGFPHTTATPKEGSEETSVHLTFNIDTHVWDLDYLSARRMALRRAGVMDAALGQSREEDNRYVGKVNELPKELHEDLLDMLPLGFLDDEPKDGATVDAVTHELQRISLAVDPDTFSKVDESIWKETVSRLREHGMELLEIHRDMYLAAMEEGRMRVAEDAMTAHLGETQRRTLSPERMQRLSLFRVQRYYEKISATKDKLVEWSYSGNSAPSSDDTMDDGSNGTRGATATTAALPPNWAFTLPVKVGDQVEADLGGAFFPAMVTKVIGDTYDVKFFDGDQETGLERSLIKLLRPPNLAEDKVDTSHMTPKQLKRWTKEQEKKTKSRGR